MLSNLIMPFAVIYSIIILNYKYSVLHWISIFIWIIGVCGGILSDIFLSKNKISFN